MQLIDPIPGTFTYAAWRVKPPRGIATGSSAERGALRDQIAAVLLRLTQTAAATARLFEVTSVAPGPGRPANDLIALLDAGSDLSGDLYAATREAGIAAPVLTLAATNAARFGDTDAHPGPILLNHFIGAATPDQAAEGWTTISNWYADVLGVDNSTLLQFGPGAPFVITNYAGIPTTVPQFMTAQLRRPSFYRHVVRPLAGLRLRPCPVFARRVPLG